MEEDLIMEGSRFLPNTMLSMSVPQNVPTMYFVNATPPQRSFSQHHVHNIDMIFQLKVCQGSHVQVYRRGYTK